MRIEGTLPKVKRSFLSDMFLRSLIMNGVATLKGRFPNRVSGGLSGESHSVLETLSSNFSVKEFCEHNFL